MMMSCCGLRQSNQIYFVLCASSAFPGKKKTKQPLGDEHEAMMSNGDLRSKVHRNLIEETAL